jgi:NCAIR mutase (PurE)-related protein
LHPPAEYHDQARVITVKQAAAPTGVGTVLVACAGTSDLPVAEEAAITADVMGNTVDRLYDVGVAGIHRLLHERARLRIRARRDRCRRHGRARCRASSPADSDTRDCRADEHRLRRELWRHRRAARMLNSCANGVAVVNIDNGFGAACMASAINHL